MTKQPKLENEEELFRILQQQLKCDPSVIEDFMGGENKLDSVLSELL